MLHIERLCKIHLIEMWVCEKVFKILCRECGVCECIRKEVRLGIRINPHS